jgi:hypothetical protein
MNDLPIMWVLAAIGVVAVLAILLRFFKVAAPPPYEQRDDFLTPTELDFFKALEQAVGGRWYIFPKVRIGDLLSVADGTQNALGWFARVSQKHVDFILADRKSVKPILVIELDDSSHQRPDRIERDEFVDSAFNAAGLGMLRIPAAMEYDANEVARRLKSALD